MVSLSPETSAFLWKLICLFIGWLLGLLGPPIVDKIRRAYRIKDLKAAISNELHELQVLMAIMAYRLNDYSALLSDEFLNWLESILHDYKGDEPIKNLKELIPSLKQIPMENRFALSYPNGREGRALGLMQYNLPLTQAHLSEVAIMPIPLQAWILKIVRRLELINQRSEHLQGKLEKTFDASLNDQNHANLKIDLLDGYRDLGKQAKGVADLIGKM